MQGAISPSWEELVKITQEEEDRETCPIKDSKKIYMLKKRDMMTTFGMIIRIKTQLRGTHQEDRYEETWENWGMV